MLLIKVSLLGLIGFSLCMANISGIVTDNSGTNALSGAVVKLEKSGQIATTGADGRFTLFVGTAIRPRLSNQLQRPKLSVIINNNLLCMDIPQRSAIEITTFNLTGIVLSRVNQTLNAGAHSIALSNKGAGLYLFNIKSNAGEFVIKGYKTSMVLQERTRHVQVNSIKNDVKTQAGLKSNAINDVIAVTKIGYSNYRVMVTNSDTSNIAIRMIICADTVRDKDGHLYQAVKIGNQVWMTENLKTTKYNDGMSIPLVTDSQDWGKQTPRYCWYGNNVANKNLFGALYNWYTVNTGKLAPTGWHVPSEPEWDTLQNYLIANGYNYDGTTSENKISKSLAAKLNWNQTPVSGTPGNDLSINNRSGFSAFPSGYRNQYGLFLGILYYGYWWSTNEYDLTDAWYRYLIYSAADMYRNSTDNSYGYSVRCLRD